MKMKSILAKVTLFSMIGLTAAQSLSFAQEETYEQYRERIGREFREEEAKREKEQLARAEREKKREDADKRYADFRNKENDVGVGVGMYQSNRGAAGNSVDVRLGSKFGTWGDLDVSVPMNNYGPTVGHAALNFPMGSSDRGDFRLSDKVRGNVLWHVGMHDSATAQRGQLGVTTRFVEDKEDHFESTDYVITANSIKDRVNGNREGNSSWLPGFNYRWSRDINDVVIAVEGCAMPVANMNDPKKVISPKISPLIDARTAKPEDIETRKQEYAQAVAEAKEAEKTNIMFTQNGLGIHVCGKASAKWEPKSESGVIPYAEVSLEALNTSYGGEKVNGLGENQGASAISNTEVVGRVGVGARFF